MRVAAALLIALLLLPAGPAAAQDREARLGRARTLNAEVLRHLQEATYRDALPKAREALAIREQLLPADDPDVATSLNNLAETLRLAGDYPGARPFAERALDIWERTLGPTHPLVATGLTNVAELRRAGGDLAGARGFLEQALAIVEQAFGATHPQVATTLNNLAYVLYAQADYSAARPLHERALAIREQAFGPNHPEVTGSLNNLALLLDTVGEYAAARPPYERALRINEQALGPEHPDVARNLNNLAELLRGTGDLAGARPLHERALAIRERALGPQHPLVATSLNNLALLLASTGDLASSQALHERALRIREQALGPSHPLVAASLANLAGILRATGQPAAARPLLERALAIATRALGPAHPDVGLMLTNLGALRRDAGDVAAAGPLYERALTILRATRAPEWRWRAALGLGRVREHDGRLADALAHYREAVQTLEGLIGQVGDDAASGRYLSVEHKTDVYDALARVLLRLHQADPSRGYDREAWAALGAKRSRIVADSLGGARTTFQDVRVRSEADRARAAGERAQALERALRDEQARPREAQQPDKIQNLTRLLAETKAEYLAQARAFLARYPRYKSQFVDQQTIDPRVLAKFADRLPAGTVAVQYFAAPDTLWIFVVAPGGRFQVKSRGVTQRALHEMVRDYRERMERGAGQPLPWADDGSVTYRNEVAPLKSLTRALAEHLLDPIATDLDTTRGVIFIPNDALLYLPLHALTRRRPDGTERFLAETHAVSYITQLELVDVLAPPPPSAAVPLLAFANPDGTLPGATREVRALAQVRPSMTAFEGPQATKARFVGLAGHFPDLHLATHGVLDRERPERSYLLLAGEGAAAERLRVDEIAGLSLPGGLAILSACETALGEQVPGAALITLAAAFSQAGSQAIIASLWKVNDAATRDFMVAFHRSLPTAGRAGGLQHAQVAVLASARTAHPYYWAGFILLGAR